MFTSEKVYDGFSTCFRQWRAEGTRCKYLHGYCTSFKVIFQGELDDRQWVQDFGGLKRSNTLIDNKSPKEWLDWLLDHSTIIAANDPELELFKEMDKRGIIQLRIIPHVGAERFAEYLFNVLNEWVLLETDGRVQIQEITFREHEKNSATYYNPLKKYA